MNTLSTHFSSLDFIFSIRKYLFWNKYLQITIFLCFLLFMMPYGNKCLLCHYKQCIWLSFGIYDYGYILRQISLAIISVMKFTYCGNYWAKLVFPWHIFLEYKKCARVCILDKSFITKLIIIFDKFYSN